MKNTLRSYLTGRDSVIATLFVRKVVPTYTRTATITNDCSYTWRVAGVDKTISFGRSEAGTKSRVDTFRNGGCDTAIYTFTVKKEIPARNLSDRTTYGTSYTLTHGAFSKTWNLADSGQLAGAAKTYTWRIGSSSCDTATIKFKLTRGLAAFTVASGRTVGFSPANLSSANTFAANTTTYGGYFTWASNYGNVKITEGSSSYDANYWRMLTKDEWNYLLKTRTTDHRKYDFATVNGVNGLILYPDSYTPAGAGVGSVTSGSSVSDANWKKMLDAGCVFLPCAGYKSGSSVSDAGSIGYYFSSTTYSSGKPYYAYFSFSSKSVVPAYSRRHSISISVRLVHNL